jgi:uncharacterized protein YndB with AHSA1/START domain
MNTRSPVTVRVTHNFRAAPERVFDAWLDPALIGQWMFGLGGRDEEVLRISLEPRPGGAFSFLVRREGQELDHVGQYLEIDRPRRLAFSWGVRAGTAEPDMSRVSIDVTPRASGSELTLTHELHPDWADFAARTESGWTTLLESLDTFLYG